MRKKIEDKLEKWVEDYATKDFDDKHTWSIYFLVDIRVVYIISSTYVAIVNLISSTANIEATDDKNTGLLYQLTSTSEGYVTEISDAVLWNCREHSVSRYYYRFLYSMLIVGLALALGGFFVTKLLNLINVSVILPKHGPTRMWRIAAFEHYQMQSDKKVAEIKTIPNEVYEEFKCCKNCWRATIPFLVLISLVIVMTFSLLAYDLHPLACLREQEDTNIQYHSEGEREGRVDINISQSLLSFQLAAGIISIVLSIIILVLSISFYCCNKSMIQDMKNKVPNHI